MDDSGGLYVSFEEGFFHFSGDTLARYVAYLMLTRQISIKDLLLFSAGEEK